MSIINCGSHEDFLTFVDIITNYPKERENDFHPGQHTSSVIGFAVINLNSVN
jgi:hypothetical protein